MENWRFKTHRSADFRVSLPPAEESAPGNDGDVPAESERAGICMNTAPPIRIQYSQFVRTQGYNKIENGPEQPQKPGWLYMKGRPISKNVSMVKYGQHCQKNGVILSLTFQPAE